MSKALPVTALSTTRRGLSGRATGEIWRRMSALALVGLVCLTSPQVDAESAKRLRVLCDLGANACLTLSRWASEKGYELEIQTTYNARDAFHRLLKGRFGGDSYDLWFTNSEPVLSVAKKEKVILQPPVKFQFRTDISGTKTRMFLIARIANRKSDVDRLTNDLMGVLRQHVDQLT